MQRKDYFIKGQVYNKEYFGENEAYKKQNGQTTFRLNKVNPDGSIEMQDLFCRHPRMVKHPELLSSTSYWTMEYLLKSQKEYKYTLVTDQKDYFIHSKRATIVDAVKDGLLKKKTVEYVFRNQSSDYIRTNPVSYHSGNDGYYMSLRLNAEQGVSENPYLQTLVFIWDTKEEIEADVRGVFPEAWFM